VQRHCTHRLQPHLWGYSRGLNVAGQRPYADAHQLLVEPPILPDPTARRIMSRMDIDASASRRRSGMFSDALVLKNILNLLRAACHLL
jgi:hypothetical protein